MTGFRSLVFSVLFYAWTAVVLVVCLPSLVLPRRTLLKVGRLWVNVSLAMLHRICAVTHSVRGLEHVPPGPCIIASKHQSAWDTLIFLALIDGPSYIFKRELLRIPLFGRFMLGAGCIPVDRSGGATSLRKMIDDARLVLAEGRKIVIFPEGTRVAPGTHRPHHPGTAALYARLGVPVVPVAVNSGLYWGRRTLLKKPGHIILEFLPPIAPGLSRKVFAAELEKRIETASNRLLGNCGVSEQGGARTMPASPDPPGPA